MAIMSQEQMIKFLNETPSRLDDYTKRILADPKVQAYLHSFDSIRETHITTLRISLPKGEEKGV